MQIQRFQSLWLLLAAIFGGVSLAYNWLRIGATFVSPLNDPMLSILAALAILLPLIGIFMFRNLKRQKLVCRLGALFALFSLGYAVALSYVGPDPEAALCVLGPSLMAVSCFFSVLAVNFIGRDEKLLRDADRLR